jgi:hypothetical protein
MKDVLDRWVPRQCTRPASAFTKSAFVRAVVVRFRSCCRGDARPQSRRHVGPHGAVAVADPVRIRDELSHHLPRFTIGLASWLAFLAGRI